MLNVYVLILLAFLVLLLTIAIFIVIVIVTSEQKTLYSPDLDPQWMDPKEMGATSDELEDVTVTTEDGVTLRGWFYRTFLQKLIAKIEQEQGKKTTGKKSKGQTTTESASNDLKPAQPLIGSPTVLYLHGNSGNISHRYPLLRSLANGTQFNLFVVDYRGYGKSEGKPSEEGLKKDAEAMLKALVARDDIDKSRIIVYGQGLGGSLAFHLATAESTRKLFQAMVIENTFTSVRDMAETLLPSWLSPLSALIKSNFDSVALLREKKLEIPTLFVATAQDEVVPYNQMKQLFRTAQRCATPACKENIKMIRYEGADHHNVVIINEEAFFKNLLEWSCKVLLHDSFSEEDMRQIQEGFAELSKQEDPKEEPELLETPEDDGEEDEGDDDKDDDDDNDDDVTVVPKSELRKRAHGSDDNSSELNDQD